VFVPTQPTFAWTYFGTCPPTQQILRIRASGGTSTDIPLSGAARSYQLATPLPACARVRWDVTALDAGRQERGSRSASFVTTGC
jgi:hypothetical protein